MKKIKIDRFYVFLVLIFVSLSLAMVIVFRHVFSTLSKSTEVDEEFLKANTPRLQRDSLDQAYGLIYNKEIPDLDL